MSSTRVFEDFDLPGEGQPFRIVVLIDLVDSATRTVVKEAYHDGITIAGTRRAPIDGGPTMWWTQGLARAQWELPLAPNSEIVYRGTPGGTFWRRRVDSRSPYAFPAGNIAKSTAYIDVPVSAERLIFGELVVPLDGDMPDTSYNWPIVAGDLWSHSLRFTDPDPDPNAEPGSTVPTDMTGYTMELELRRTFFDTVRAMATFDYTDVATGIIGMKLTSEDTALLYGHYIGSIQQYDPEGERTTLDTWSFDIQRDR